MQTIQKLQLLTATQGSERHGFRRLFLLKTLKFSGSPSQERLKPYFQPKQTLYRLFETLKFSTSFAWTFEAIFTRKADSGPLNSRLSGLRARVERMTWRVQGDWFNRITSSHPSDVNKKRPEVAKGRVALEPILFTSNFWRAKNWQKVCKFQILAVVALDEHSLTKISVIDVIYQQRVRGFYQGFQTPRNR